jgi:hypothetical protein
MAAIGELILLVWCIRRLYALEKRNAVLWRKVRQMRKERRPKRIVVKAKPVEKQEVPEFQRPLRTGRKGWSTIRHELETAVKTEEERLAAVAEIYKGA